MESKISILIPVYKANYNKLILTLNSIKNLDYDNIELVIVIDGEKTSIDFDNILNNFNKEVKLFTKTHSGVADTVNLGMNECSGEFIFLLNQYDIIHPDRIKLALDKFRKEESLSIIVNQTFYRSSVAIRKSILPCMPYWFEQYYAPCDVEKFVFTCNIHHIGVDYINENFIINEYKQSSKNHTRIRKRLKRLYNQISKDTSNNILTCIIPFKNEKYEVEKTINSILSTTEQTSIVIINDNSDDNYFYDDLEICYPNIKYISNKKTIGHENIDLGVINSDTKFSILIDAHMRFYEDNWDIRICNFLEEHPKSIIYGNTAIIEKNPNETYINEDCKNKLIHTYGAGVNLNINSKNIFKHFWAYNDKLDDKDEIYHLSPNILGACYGFSNEWYKFIGGTYGLSQYGLSEACLAVKTWLMGGSCYRIQDFIVGHVYRNNFPYKINQFSYELNRRFLIELFSDNDEQKQMFIDCQIKNIDKNQIDNFSKNWNELYKKSEHYIKYYKSRFSLSLLQFIKDINSKFS